jgi:hypothetical protein
VNILFEILNIIFSTLLGFTKGILEIVPTFVEFKNFPVEIISILLGCSTIAATIIWKIIEKIYI